MPAANKAGRPRRIAPETTALKPAALVAWRERLTYSQREACDVLGCSRGAWAGWESGIQPVPKYIGLAMAAIALGLSPYGAKP